MSGAGGLTIGDVGSAIGIITFVSVVIGGLTSWLMKRRATSGKIDTSDAATLWQQSQDMRATAVADKVRAEEQRDRLVNSLENVVLPAIQEINNSLAKITGLFEDLLPHVKDSKSAERVVGELLRAMDKGRGPISEAPKSEGSGPGD